MNEKKKKMSWVATLIGVMVILVIAVVLTVMIVTSSDPKKSVDGLLTNLREGDFAKAQEFISGEDLVKDEEFGAETQKLLFNKMTWKVTKVTKEAEKAKVEIEVTNKDFKTIVNNYMQKALKADLSGATEKEIENYFIEELKSEQVQTTTITKTIEAIKEEEKWKVVSNDELEEVLLPGLQEAIRSLS
ncbi:MAG: hypothetical protein HFJ37_01000 [Clostridia bacterium]|nr:hypothetical protein [Clostridia bacterium]